MAEVKVGENESIESALRRFKKKIQKAGILSEVKKRERYEKPSVIRKRKSEAARKRKVYDLIKYKKPLDYSRGFLIFPSTFEKKEVVAGKNVYNNLNKKEPLWHLSKGFNLFIKVFST